MIATAVIAAGGSGSRFGNTTPKQFSPILGIPMIFHTLRAFEKARTIDRVVVVLPEKELQRLSPPEQQRFHLKKIAKVVTGGASRQESVLCGLRAIAWETARVAIHDAARCLISGELIDRTVKASDTWDGAILAMPIRDTLKRVSGETIEGTQSRENLWGMQTPQVFRFPLILDAYVKAKEDGFEATDDAQIAERTGARVRVVEGSTQNFKVTFKDDLNLAEIILRERETEN